MSFTVQQPFESAQRQLLHLLPKHRTSQLLLAGGTASVVAAVLYPLLHHLVLGRRIAHSHPNANSRIAALECGEFETLSKDIVENASAYRTVHDKVVKHIPDLTIGPSEELEGHFTQLLRHNMSRFARTPQSLSLWFAYNSPEHRLTFSQDHIDTLQFVEGDVFCGVYEVVRRIPLRVEIAVHPPPQGRLAAVSTLLVLSLRPRNEGAVLISETIQWAKKDSGVVLPLERWLPGFMHEFTSRWLVLTGAQYLRSIAGSSSAGEMKYGA